MVVDYEKLNEKFITISEAKEILDKTKDKEYEQKLAYEHAKKFAKLKPKEAKELIEKLKALNMSKLKEEFLIKIVDLLPKDIEDLKVILVGSPLSFKEDELNQILNVVKEYVK